MKTQEEVRKHKKKQNIIAGVILILGTFFAYTLLGPKKENSQVENNQEVASLVKVMAISKDSKIAKLEKTVSLSAGGGEAQVISEFSGRIKTVNFEVGDQVNEEQILAFFDQSDKENSFKVSLESAEKNYQLTKDNLGETKDLVEKNIDLASRAVKLAELGEDQASTETEKDLAKENLKIAKDQKKQAQIGGEIQINGAKIQLEQAEQALLQSKIAYEKTILKAPISGIVSSKKVNEEDFLSPGQMVATIVGNGKAEATIFLNKDEIERIKKDDAVEIKIDGKTYNGKINSYSKIANLENGRFEVKIISTENISHSTNQTAKIILNVYLDSSNQNSFFVPLDAVNIGQTKKEVFVVESGKAKSREVELGKIIGTQIEILSGLENGNVLVIKNSRNLRSEQAVKISNS